MYEKIAWDNFCKTGNLESFLEYKRINETINDLRNILEEKGEYLSEFNKGKSNSNKGNDI